MLLRGVATNIRALLTDADGEPLLKETAVTINVTKDSDGAKVVEGAKVKIAGTDGVAVYQLAAQPTLDRFTVTWVAGGSTFTTVEEMVGLRLTSLAAVAEDVTEALSAERKRVAREIAEQFLEDECGVAFRPRYAHESLDGTGKERLFLPHPKVSAVRSVTVGGTALTKAELEDVKLYDAGYLWREAGWTEGHQNVGVIYEHGFANPPPAAQRAAAQLARHLAVKRPSNLEDRATTYSTDEATYSLITPGIRGSLTALPEVNIFLSSWRFPSIN